MDQTMELQLSKALTRAHLMETVLHGRGKWEMSLGSWGVETTDLVVPARRSIDPDSVSVVAVFPAHCWLGERPTVLTLWLEGEMVGVRAITHPGDGGFEVSWSFAIEVLEQAA